MDAACPARFGHRRDKPRLVHAIAGRVERGQLDSIGEGGSEPPQHRIDMPDDHADLRREIVAVERLAAARLVHLPADVDELLAAHTMLEREVAVPVPVSFRP